MWIMMKDTYLVALNEMMKMALRDTPNILRTYGTSLIRHCLLSTNIMSLRDNVNISYWIQTIKS